MMSRLKPGDLVRHFKRETIDQSTLKYLYKFIAIATHSETREKMAVYLSMENGEFYVRPYDMFMSKVDKAKYPNIKQEYRFEKAEE